MPHGRTKPISIEVDNVTYEKYEQLKAYGASFEIEMLSDYATISATIEKENNGNVDILASFLKPNGPEIRDAIVYLVRDAFEKKLKDEK